MGGMGGMTGGSGKPAMSCGGGGMASMEMAQKQSDEKMMGDMDHSKMEMDHSKMDMSEPSTETDANKQFVTSMVPHHQSAVDMSIKYLKTGSDPELIKLAQAIIAAQEKEIAILQAWKSKATK